MIALFLIQYILCIYFFNAIHLFSLYFPWFLTLLSHEILLKCVYYVACIRIKVCRDQGSNQGPLDLQSNALPTELSRLLQQVQKCLSIYTVSKWGRGLWLLYLDGAFYAYTHYTVTHIDRGAVKQVTKIWQGVRDDDEGYQVMDEGWELRGEEWRSKN